MTIPTAAQIALARADEIAGPDYAPEHPIPPITDPLGKCWDQPARSEILVDDTHALMTRRTFDGLAEYSGTYPTGVYPGKMWRRHDGIFDPEYRARGGKPVWLLCWYGFSEKGPDWCSNNARKILLVDGEL